VCSSKGQVLCVYRSSFGTSSDSGTYLTIHEHKPQMPLDLRLVHFAPCTFLLASECRELSVCGLYFLVSCSIEY